VDAYGARLTSQAGATAMGNRLYDDGDSRRRRLLERVPP